MFRGIRDGDVRELERMARGKAFRDSRDRGRMRGRPGSGEPLRVEGRLLRIGIRMGRRLLADLRAGHARRPWRDGLQRMVRLSRRVDARWPGIQPARRHARVDESRRRVSARQNHRRVAAGLPDGVGCAQGPPRSAPHRSLCDQRPLRGCSARSRAFVRGGCRRASLPGEPPGIPRRKLRAGLVRRGDERRL